jgi:hypothetical protein
MPDANHDQTHDNHGSIVSEDIDENLQNWLTDRTRDRVVEILDAEEEGKQNE